MLKSLRRSTALRQAWWDGRRTLGLPVKHDLELLHRLQRQEDLLNGAGSFEFPWGKFEFVSAGQLRVQFEEIFVRRQYAFASSNPSPVILDCGGNIGLSAVWFKLNYPKCQLTVYEADPDLAKIIKANLQHAGITDVSVLCEAVWVQNGKVAFQKTGDDSGKIISEGMNSYPAIDLAEYLPEKVDLLKLDIEGAEFQVLDRLCQTGVIERVQNLVCEFHVWRDKTDLLLHTLAQLRATGFQLVMSAEIAPWLGLADAESPFECVNRQQVLMEVFAWRSPVTQSRAAHK